MYGVEHYAQVRRACHVEDLSIRESARRFGLDRRTVAKMLRHPVPLGYRPGRVSHFSLTVAAAPAMIAVSSSRFRYPLSRRTASSEFMRVFWAIISD